MQLSRYTFLAAVLFTIAAYLFNAWTVRMPPVRPASAPKSEFSAARAFADESQILMDHLPHPNGSQANDRVRLRIERFLTENDIPWEIQRAWGCSSQYNRCGWVQNIIARVSGERPHPYVALMAHYDSMPEAPGGGDDGAGFITVLETAKTMKAEGLHRNPLLLVITDGEEMGLLGAEAFFGQHPLANYIGALINIEGAGSSGPSQVLRTGGHDARLISLYHQVAAYPFATSLTSEIFKHMPNDTDFSVARRHGVPGIEFAYAGEFNHYHTPNDSLANLDKRTLQHHGENVLPLTRALLNANLEKVANGTNDVYLQTLGIWLQWPFWANWLLLGFAGVIIAAMFVRRPAGSRGWREWTTALVAPFLVIAGTFSAGIAAFIVVRLVVGTINAWPAVEWPYKLLLMAAPLAGGIAVAYWFNRRVQLATALIAAWLWWWLLAVLATATLPGAAGVLLTPLVAGVVCVFAATFVEKPWLRSLVCAASLIVATTFTLNTVPWLEQSQGYQLFFVCLPFIALYVVALWPLARGSGVRAMLAVLVVLSVTGIIFAATSPLYSRWRPQHVNIQYVEDVDQHKGWYHLASPNPPPKRMLARMDFVDRVAVYPWSDIQVDKLAAAKPSGWLPPVVKVLSDKRQGAMRELELQLQMQRPGLLMALILPDSVKPKQFYVDDVPLAPHRVDRGFTRGKYMIMLTGMAEAPVTVRLDLGSDAPFTAWVTDGSTELPDSASGLMASRPPLAVPAQLGDEAMLIERVDL